MTLMIALVAALAGFGLFASAHPRQRREQGWEALTRRSVVVRRGLAVALLAGSLVAAFRTYGPRFGPIAWVGLMTLAALSISLGGAVLGARRPSPSRRNPC